MGCPDCPDAKDLEGMSYIVYTGGPPEAPFAAVALAIHDDGIIRRYRPFVHPDGSIEYVRDVPEPPVPEGYARDEQNPWLLRPIWVSCVYRMYRTKQLEDGTLKIDGLCTHPDAGMPAHKPVTNAKCCLCNVRCAIGSFPAVTGDSRRGPDEFILSKQRNL